MHLCCVCVDIVVFQVALEVIEELCYEMALHRLEAMEEYAIFLVTNRGVFIHVCTLPHAHTLSSSLSVSHTLNFVLVQGSNLLVIVSEATPLTDRIHIKLLSGLKL